MAFSCKRRGFCPSCGARRMAETAAHLVEHVLPEQPIRQWVLSFPYPLRFLFATRPAVLTQVLGAAKPMSVTPSNAFAATSPARQSRTNASRSMTAGRSCIGSSTPSMTGRLMSCSTRWTLSPASPPLEVPLAQRARSVPRHRAHLTRYHGVFAPNFKHRHHIVPNPSRPATREPLAARPRSMSWMQRLKRVFHIDIERCGVCGGTLRLTARPSSVQILPDMHSSLSAPNHVHREIATLRPTTNLTTTTSILPHQRRSPG